MLIYILQYCTTSRVIKYPFGHFPHDSHECLIHFFEKAIKYFERHKCWSEHYVRNYFTSITAGIMVCLKVINCTRILSILVYLVTNFILNINLLLSLRYMLYLCSTKCAWSRRQVLKVFYQGSYKYASLSRVSNTLWAQHPFPFRNKLEKALRGLY